MPEKAKPAVIPNGGHRSIFVSNWKAHEKNTLQGILSLNLPSGIVIHNCTLHKKGTARWIGLPARDYSAADGKVSWSPMVEFASKESRYAFQDAALEAIDRFLAEGGGQ
jgi:hypothetical protein